MNCNQDIDYIRSLLSRYYLAETSPEDEEILERFFSDVDITEIPEDLVSDKKMFDLTRQLHPAPDDCPVPDDLSDRLNRIVETPTPRNVPVRKKRIRLILRYLSGAAAACILLAIAVAFMRQSQPAGQDVKVVAETPWESETPVIVAQSEGVIDQPEEESVASVNKSISGQRKEQAEDGLVEITDPEEAREILLNIGKLLARNAEDTNDAIAHIGNSIDCYKEITKSILQ